jgi:hypothetical protein
LAKKTPNKGIEMDFEKLALFKTTHARRTARLDAKLGAIRMAILIKHGDR